VRAPTYRRDGRLGELHEGLRYCDGDERIWHGYGATPRCYRLSLLVEIDGRTSGSAFESCLVSVSRSAVQLVTAPGHETTDHGC